jgi:hypothetical protein
VKQTTDITVNLVVIADHVKITGSKQKLKRSVILSLQQLVVVTAKTKVVALLYLRRQVCLRTVLSRCAQAVHAFGLSRRRSVWVCKNTPISKQRALARTPVAVITTVQCGSLMQRATVVSVGTAQIVTQRET